MIGTKVAVPLSTDRLLELVAEIPGLGDICPDVLVPYLLRSKAYAARKSLFGWMQLDEFAARLEDEE